MSNNQVGSVYQQIIQDVIDASRVDFEEGGIDEGVLEELKKGWQKKLTQQQLAVFPWDPKPDPPAPALAAPASTAPLVQAQTSTAGAESNGAMYTPPNGAQGLAMPQLPKPEPNVKLEPGSENAGNYGGDSTNVASQRAIEALANQYGERAAGSIAQVRNSNGQVQGQQMPMPGQQVNQYSQQTQQQFRLAPGAQPGQPNPSQMDGASDDLGPAGVLMYRSASGEQTEMGRMEIDSMLHAQIAARAREMEGGGFMVPLKRSSKKSKATRTSGSSSTAANGPSQFDGVDDDDLKDDEEDEDAINSDLDDPDDNLDDDDEDEDGGQIMLCMYDKVQRVKNKWKCVLKDGVLSINGKDYVFHKATGEYEW